MAAAYAVQERVALPIDIAYSQPGEEHIAARFAGPKERSHKYGAPSAFVVTGATFASR